MLNQGLLDSRLSRLVANGPYVYAGRPAGSTQVCATGSGNWSRHDCPLLPIEVFGQRTIVHPIVARTYRPNVVLPDRPHAVEGIGSRRRGHFAPSRTALRRCLM